MSKICSKCGAELNDSALLCSSCGTIGGAIDPADIPDSDWAKSTEGITPLIIHSHEQTETADDTQIADTVHDEDADSAEPVTTAKSSARKYKYIMIFVCTAVVLLIAAAVFFKNSKEEGAPPGYRSALNDYFSALCLGDGNKLLDATEPDHLISCYEERAAYRLDDYETSALNKRDKLTDLFGADVTVSFDVTSKEQIDETQLREYAITYELAANAHGYEFECDISKGYYVELEITAEGASSKAANCYADAVVLNADGKWIVYSLHCGDIPTLGTTPH